MASPSLLRRVTAVHRIPPPSLFLSRRQFSTKAQLIEIDLTPSSQPSSSSSSNGDKERDALGIKKLEEMIHRIVVQRSTPDWLPFVPGSSFWVPPQSTRPVNVEELVNKLVNPLSDEQALSLTSMRGWPCSSFFVKDGLSSPRMEVKVKLFTTSDNTRASDEEEG